MLSALLIYPNHLQLSLFLNDYLDNVVDIHFWWLSFQVLVIPYSSNLHNLPYACLPGFKL